MKKQVLLSLGVALALWVAPCRAGTITFANFVNTGLQDVTMTYDSQNLTDTLQISGTIYFFFHNISVPAAVTGLQVATLTLTATTSDPSTGLGTVIDQGGYSGTFSIILQTPVGGLSDLLSGSFGPSNSDLSGAVGQASPTFRDSTPPNGEVMFTSDFATFYSGPGTLDAFSISMSSAINSSPSVSGLTLAGNNFVNSFGAAESGTFSEGNAQPEPLSFLLLGSGLIGLGLLRRKLR